MTFLLRFFEGARARRMRSRVAASEATCKSGSDAPLLMTPRGGGYGRVREARDD